MSDEDGALATSSAINCRLFSWTSKSSGGQNQAVYPCDFIWWHTETFRCLIFCLVGSLRNNILHALHTVCINIVLSDWSSKLWEHRRIQSQGNLRSVSNRVLTCYWQRLVQYLAGNLLLLMIWGVSQVFLVSFFPQIYFSLKHCLYW